MLGDLVADQVVDVVLRLTFPYGQLGRETGLIVRAIDREGAFEAAGVRDARLSWTWADDHANDAQPRDVDVDRAVARQFAARARQEAVAANRVGDFEAARRVLEGTAKRIRKYAGRDAPMRALIDELESETGRFAAPMSAPLLKQMHFASANVARSRDVTGPGLPESMTSEDFRTTATTGSNWNADLPSHTGDPVPTAVLAPEDARRALYIDFEGRKERTAGPAWLQVRRSLWQATTDPRFEALALADGLESLTLSAAIERILIRAGGKGSLDRRMEPARTRCRSRLRT